MFKQPVFFAAMIVVLLGSLFVVAAPGAPDRFIPYRGVLQQNGVAITAPDLSMTFSLYDVESNGVALWTSSRDVAVADGTFALALGSNVTLPDAVFESDGLFLAIDVDGVPLAGRQRVFAAPQSVRAGHASLVQSNETTPRTGYSISPGAIAGIAIAGAVVTTDGDSVVTGSADVDGNLDVAGDADVAGNISAAGLYERPSFSDGCPPGMERVGIWCIDEVVRAAQPLSQGSANAMQTCHDDGAIICPIAALSLCDELDVRDNITTSCGGRTDRGSPAGYRILTSDVGWIVQGNAATVINVLFGESHFNNMACYDPTAQEAANSFDSCNTDSSEEFFCCTMAAPTMRPAP